MERHFTFPHNDWTEWDLYSDDGKATVSGNKAVFDVQNGDVSIQYMKCYTDEVRRFRVKFTINFATLSMTNNGDNFRICPIMSDGFSHYAYVSIYRTGASQYDFRVWSTTDGASTQTTTIKTSVATATDYVIEMDYKCNSNATTEDGQFRAWLDGTLVEERLGLDIDDHEVSQANIGAAYDIDAGTVSNFSISDVYVNDTGYEPGTTPSRVYTDDANIQGRWQLNEATGTRVDETANGNDLTDNNSVLANNTDTMHIKSADFERSNSEYLSIADGSQTGLDITGNITIDARVKIEALSGGNQYHIVSKYNTSGDQRSYRLFVEEESGNWRFKASLSGDGAAATTAISGTDVVTATWYRVTVVYNGTDIRIYVNGLLDSNGSDNPATYSSGIYNSSAAFDLGRLEGLGRYWDGEIDDCVIFDRALDADEVYSLFNEYILYPAAPVYNNDANLQGHWYLDEVSGTRKDHTGNSNDLTDNNTVLYNTDKKQGSASADLESSNSEYLSIADGSQTGLDITGNITIMCWMQKEAVGVLDGIVGKWDDGSDEAYLMYVASTDRFYFAITPDGSTDNYAHSPSNTVQAGRWYHVACVYDGSEMILYVNGEIARNGADNPLTYSSGIHDANTAPFVIGALSNPSNYFDGEIDEVAVFDRALSQNEINDVMNNNIQHPSAQVAANDANFKGIWRLEEPSGTRKDFTTNHNDLTDNNTVTRADDRKEALYSARCTAANSEYLSITNAAQTGLDPAGNISFGGWYKLITSAASYRLMGKHNTAAGQRGYEMRIDSPTQIVVTMSSDGTAQDYPYTYNNVLKTYNWYHLVTVYNGTDVRIYINGILWENGARNPRTYAAGIFNNTSAFNIGIIDGSGLYFNGRIDEQFVYAGELTEDQINDIYKNGIAGLRRRVNVS